MRRFLTGFLFTFLVSAVGFAQIPKTQLYVFDLALRDTAVALTNPRYLSDFNAFGYNNQPYWSDEETLLASVQLPGEAQPDIYRFDLANRTRQQLTDTDAGEYSPKVQVAGGNRFTAVRQEFVGADTILRLWDFPGDLADNGRPVFSTQSDIGYYEWLNPSQLALFLVENPSRLVLSAAGDGATPQTLATETGRTFARMSNGNLVYVDKSTTPWRLMQKNLYRLDEPAESVAELPDGTEDFVLLRDGSFLTGQGSKLYRLFPNRESRWQLVADLNFYGLRDITRMALSNDGQLAIVAE
ncbi:hypothetical protein CLV84_4161 [Neolewinella xylanilytica]|uniref:S9 family peptidase n=1 Tax=Neolewinella xylanilytica TaxID=1514080 RepID=A0A2S6I0K2_9BACT|nr:hypothetical protein [Neolewinella xylanilytica]PPK84391.1 hypothetical protein CLV84_4161 [Neolewinella xylanilytica]